MKLAFKSKIGSYIEQRKIKNGLTLEFEIVIYVFFEVIAVRI